MPKSNNSNRGKKGTKPEEKKRKYKKSNKCLSKYRVAIATVALKKRDFAISHRKATKKPLSLPPKEKLPKIFKQGKKGREAVLARIGCERCQPKVWKRLNKMSRMILMALSERIYVSLWKPSNTRVTKGIDVKIRVESSHVEYALEDCGIQLTFPVAN